MISINYIKPFLFALPLFLLQFTVIPLITYNNIGPDLIIIPVIYYALKHGKIYGSILGFILGFLFDIISGGIIGTAMFAKTFTGFATGYLHNENKMTERLASYGFILIAVIAASLNAFLYAVLNGIGTDIGYVGLIIEISVLPGIYTAVMSFPIIIFGRRSLFNE